MLQIDVLINGTLKHGVDIPNNWVVLADALHKDYIPGALASPRVVFSFQFLYVPCLIL